MAANSRRRAAKRKAAKKSAAAQQARIRRLQNELNAAQEQLKSQAAAHRTALEGARKTQPPLKEDCAPPFDERAHQSGFPVAEADKRRTAAVQRVETEHAAAVEETAKHARRLRMQWANERNTLLAVKAKLRSAEELGALYKAAHNGAMVQLQLAMVQHAAAVQRAFWAAKTSSNPSHPVQKKVAAVRPKGRRTIFVD